MLEQDAAVVGRELLQIDVVERPLLLGVLVQDLLLLVRCAVRVEQRVEHLLLGLGEHAVGPRDGHERLHDGDVLIVHGPRGYDYFELDARATRVGHLRLAALPALASRPTKSLAATCRRLRNVVGPATRTSKSCPQLELLDARVGPEPDEHPDLGAARRRDDVHRARAGPARRPRCPARPRATGRSRRRGPSTCRAAPPPRSAAFRRRPESQRAPAGTTTRFGAKPSAVATNSRRAPTGMSATSTGACPDRSSTSACGGTSLDDERRPCRPGSPAPTAAAGAGADVAGVRPASAPGRQLPDGDGPQAHRNEGEHDRRAPSRAFFLTRGLLGERRAHLLQLRRLRGQLALVLDAGDAKPPDGPRRRGRVPRRPRALGGGGLVRPSTSSDSTSDSRPGAGDLARLEAPQRSPAAAAASARARPSP